MKKPKTPKVKDCRTKSFTDMRMFYRDTDWAALWEDYYLGITPDGKQKYRSILAFARIKGSSKYQVEFLTWYLGTKKNGDEKNEKFSFVTSGPVDWAAKRKTGGWYTEDNLVKFSVEITRRMNALEALREAGNKITLNSLVRAEQLAQQIDKAFCGTMFLPDLDWKQNKERAQLYIDLHRDVLELKGKAQDLYAKSHGVNFEDMSGLVQLMTATAMAATQQRMIDGDAPLSREEAAIKSLVRMTMAKAARYKLPLPAGAEEQIIDVVQSIDTKRVAKKGVN